MKSLLSRLLGTLAAIAILAPAGVSFAVDAAPRVKPRKGLRKHLKRRPGKNAGKGKLGPIGVVTDFDKGTPLWVIREIFKCALDYDEGSGFACYAKHNAEINVGTSRALKHLRR